MPVEIRSLQTVSNPEALRALVSAYLAHELKELEAVSGLAYELGPLVAATFDHLDDYLPPRGRLRVAEDGGGALIGCVFLKMIRADAAEVKRLYVRPEARGQGLGRRLVTGILDEAREMGAARVLLDTGVYDTAAHRLYESLGFRDIGAYPESENDPELAPFLRYMQLDW